MVSVRPFREGQLFSQPIWNLHLRPIMLVGRPQLLSHLHIQNKRLKVALESAHTKKTGVGGLPSEARLGHPGLCVGARA